MSKYDENDFEYVKQQFGSPIRFLACPKGKNGKINPHVTQFLMENGKIISVFHIKPIYYETVRGEWQPISEITSYHGNKKIILNKNWRNASSRFINWLGKRQKLLGKELLLPTPFDVPFAYQPLVRPEIPIGLTITTVYPDPNPETTTIDGRVRSIDNASWASARSDAGDEASDTDASIFMQGESTGGLFYIGRMVFLFDTSSIGDTDTIDSGVFSLKHDSASGSNTTETTNPANLALVSSAPASNTSLSASDYASANWGTTQFATALAISTFSGGGSVYHEWTLNADGKNAVSKTGVTKYGIRPGNDFSDSTPPSARSYSFMYMADESGTTSDPKLVITHTAVAGLSGSLSLLGVGT